MFIQPKTNYTIILVFLGLTGLPSCWGWEEPQEGGRATPEEEVRKAISTLEEGEMVPKPREEQWQGYSRQETEDYEETGRDRSPDLSHEELKDVMTRASRQMKRLEGSLREDNWTTARDSAKNLEELIGRRCVNSYVKAHKEVTQDFVQMSQRFNDAVLRLLVAERHQDTPLAQSQFQLMQEGCKKCHQKYRKEKDRRTGLD